ncbi:MAG: hypothetical protein ACUVX8_18810 [Candidatus Zipacnadales bacterium]
MNSASAVFVNWRSTIPNIRAREEETLWPFDVQMTSFMAARK